MLGRGEHFGMVVRESHRRFSQWAAKLAGDGGTGDAVIAIVVVSADAPELVAGQLGGGVVVGCDGVRARAAGQGREREQGARGGRAVEVAVGEHRAREGPLLAAVGGVQVHHQPRTRRAQRQREVLGDPVRVARVRKEVTGEKCAAGEASGERCHRDRDRVTASGAEGQLSHQLGDLSARARR